MERQRLWVLVSIGVLASCAADSARVAVERSSEREQHRLAAEVFVQHASAGNVSELLTLMANVTLQANEPGALEAYLRDQVAPFFQGYSRLHWQGQFLPVQDEQGNKGAQYYEFVEASDGEVHPFVITLFPEAGDHRVTSIVVGECFWGYHLKCP